MKSEKIICQRTEAPQKDLRPPYWSIRRGESDSAGTILVGALFLHVLKKKAPKKDHTKIVPADLDSPRRELFVRGLGFVVALSVRWQIDFSCAFPA